MATLLLESAVLCSNGVIVRLKWRSALPTNYSVVDWLAGYNAGKWFTFSHASGARHCGTCKFVDSDGTLCWITYLRTTTPIVYGSTGVTVSIDAGLLSDRWGNVNEGVTGYTVDATRTLVDASGFLDQSITPPNGVPTVYINPEDGLTNPTWAQVKDVHVAAKTFNKARDLVIANGFQGAGVHFKYVQGKVESRLHTDPYNVIQTWGPSPSQPCIIAPCAPDGGPATDYAKIRLSNNGVNNGGLYGFVREGGGANPSNTPNVCISGFDIRNTDPTGTSDGAAVLLANGASNCSLIDVRMEKTLIGVNAQYKQSGLSIHRCSMLDHWGIAPHRGFGIYADFVLDLFTITDPIMDRCGRTSPNLIYGDNQLRNVYISKQGQTEDAIPGPPTGPMLMSNAWHFRGQDTTTQLRTGMGSGVVYSECPGAGFSGGQGGAGWNHVVQLKSPDFIDSVGSPVNAGVGVSINNSIRDHNNALSSEEGSKGGIIEACLVDQNTGTLPAEMKAASVLGSNYQNSFEYVLRNNISRNGGPIVVNCESAYRLGKLTAYNNIVDQRGAPNAACLRFENDYNTGGNYTFLAFSNNVYVNSNANAIVTIAGLAKTLAQYKTATGLDSDVSSTPPTYKDPNRTLVSWAASQGLVVNDAGFYTAARDRAFRTWPSYLDAYAAYQYFADGLQATNYSSYGSGYLDFIGLPLTLPTFKKTSGTAPTVTGAVISSSGTVLTITCSANIVLGTLAGTLTFASGAAITLTGITVVIVGAVATISFGSRGTAYASDACTLTLQPGSFKNASTGVAMAMHSASVTNNSTVPPVTHPTLVSARSTNNSISLTFSEDIVLGTLIATVTTPRDQLILDGLPVVISSRQATITYPYTNAVYSDEAVSVRVEAGSFKSAANGGDCAFASGSVTNRALSTIIPAEIGKPVVSSVVCTATDITFTFNVAVVARTIAGTIMSGYHAPISLTGLVPTLAGNSATFSFISRGTVFQGNAVQVTLEADSFRDANSQAYPSAAYSGTATNTSNLTDNTNEVPASVYLATFNTFTGYSPSTPDKFLAHGIQSHPLTQIYVVGRVDGTTSSQYAPPGYGISDTQDDDSVAQLIFNWVDYYYTKLKSAYQDAGKAFAWAFWLQNAGATTDGSTPYSNTTSLLKNAADKVSTATALNGYSSPFTRNGREGLRARLLTVFTKLQQLLQDAGRPMPVEMQTDFEDFLRVDLACTSSSDGWLAPSLASAKATDPADTVDGANTFATVFAAKKDVNGNSFSYANNQNMYDSATNLKLFNFLLGLATTVSDFAQAYAIRDPLRIAFPGVPFGAYDQVQSNGAYPEPLDKANLYKYTVADLKADSLCPVLYPLRAVSFTGLNSSYAEQCARYGLSSTPTTIQADMAALYVARSIAQLNAAFGAKKTTQEVSPWIIKPGHTETFTTEYPGGGTYTVTEAEILAIMQAGQALGVTRWNWFFPDPTLAQLDEGLRVLEAYSPSTSGLIPTYKFDTCGIIPVLLASGAVRRLLVISDHPEDEGTSQSWSGHLYNDSTPIGPIVGWWGNGEINPAREHISPVRAITVDFTDISAGVSLWPYYTPGQGASNTPEGFFYSESDYGSGADGLAAVWGIDVSQELVWAGIPGANTVLWQYSVNYHGDFFAPWTSDALRALVVWHQPDANPAAFPEITGGPTLGLGYSRGASSTTIVTQVAGGTAEALKYGLFAIPSGAGIPNIRIAQGASGTNQDRRMVPIGCLVESTTATEGLVIIPCGVPYTSAFMWDPAGSAGVVGEPIGNTGVNVLDVFRLNGLQIDGAIVCLGQFMVATELQSATPPSFIYDNAYNQIAADIAPPPGGSYIEAFEDNRDYLTDVMGGAENPVLHVAPHFAGFADSLANAALYRQRMEKEFIDALNRTYGGPNATAASNLLYTKYGFKDRVGYINPWYNISALTILTGQGGSQYIRRNGTTFRGDWTAVSLTDTAYAVGDVVFDKDAPDYTRLNIGWYVCVTAHTAAASGVNGPPSDATSNKWLPCDFHLNDNGMRHVVQFIWSKAATTPDATIPPYEAGPGLPWTDPLLFNVASGGIEPLGDYLESVGTVRFQSGKAEFQSAGSILLKSPRNLVGQRKGDYTYTDGIVRATYDSDDGTSGISFALYVHHDNKTEAYVARVVRSTGVVTLGRIGPYATTYATATLGAISGNSVWELSITRTLPAAPVLTLKRNGITELTATATGAPYLDAGLCGWGGSLTSGTIKLTLLSTTCANPYVAPTRPALTGPRFLKLFSTLSGNGGVPNTRGQVPDTLWYGGWEAYFSLYVDSFLAAGGQGIMIRGGGGNNSVGLNFAQSYYIGSSDTSVPSVCNILPLISASYLRTMAGLATAPADSRLGDGIGCALTSRRIPHVIMYDMLPPNGYNVGGTSITGTVYPSSNAAFDFYYQFQRTTAAEIACDTAGSMNPAHAKSLVAKAALDRAKTYSATRKPILEPHMEQVAGGTSGTWNNTAAMADGSVSYICTYSRYLTINANQNLWLGVGELNGGESIVLIDGGDVVDGFGQPDVPGRIAAIALAKARGWSVVAETDDMSFTQMQDVNAMFNVSSVRQTRTLPEGIGMGFD